VTNYLVTALNGGLWVDGTLISHSFRQWWVTIFLAGLTILPPKGDLEKAAKLLISFANSQVVEGADLIDYLPRQTQQEIRQLLRISDPDKR